MIEIIIIAFLETAIVEPLLSNDSLLTEYEITEEKNITITQRCENITDYFIPNKKIKPSPEHEISLEKQARNVGVQIGFYDGTAAIYQYLDDKTTRRQLDNYFNFQRIVYKGQMLLPVVSINENLQIFDFGEQKRRDIDLILTIDRPALFISDLPTWHDYLYQIPSYNSIPLTNVGYHPNEYHIFNTALCEGYRLGQQQAFLEFQANLERLVKDYTGMVLAYKLVARNVLTLPDFEVLELGDERRFSGKERLILGQRIYQINQQPTFITPDKWVLKDLTASEAITR